MEQKCIDLFKAFDLPFKTYLATHLKTQTVSHQEIEILWLFKGSAQLTYDHVTYHMTDNTVFFVCIHKDHAITTSDDAILVGFSLNNDYLKSHGYAFDTIKFSPRVYTFTELRNKYHQVPLIITQLLKLLMVAQPTPITRLRILGYYKFFISELYHMLTKDHYLDRKARDFDPYLIRLSAIMDYVHQHANRPISIDLIASELSLSRYRLSHFVKESLGISFYEFVQNTRLDAALTYLQETDLPVGQIAQLSGFSDVKYLNKLLKESHHMTALKYRKYMAQLKGIPNKVHTNLALIYQLKKALHDLETDQGFVDTYGLSRVLAKK